LVTSGWAADFLGRYPVFTVGEVKFADLPRQLPCRRRVKPVHRASILARIVLSGDDAPAAGVPAPDLAAAAPPPTVACARSALIALTRRSRAAVIELAPPSRSSKLSAGGPACRI